jgi:hypothetical protein
MDRREKWSEGRKCIWNMVMEKNVNSKMDTYVHASIDSLYRTLVLAKFHEVYADLFQRENNCIFNPFSTLKMFRISVTHSFT